MANQAMMTTTMTVRNRTRTMKKWGMEVMAFQMMTRQRETRSG